MSLKLARSVVAAGLGAGVLLAAGAAGAEINKASLKVVGTWPNITNYYGYEKPFYLEQLPKATGGKIKAQLNPLTELGLKGWEVMRLLKLGVFDVAHGVYGYVSSEDPALEGVDLSSAAKDFREAKKIVAAYEPVIRERFNETFGAKYLYTFRWPSQMIWCNQPINKLSDLKGKKIRVYSTTLGDFVSGVGGTSVTITFAEVVPALQKGVADCGITGTMPAFQAKWHEVITHAMLMPVGAGLGFAAMSNKRWNALNGETQGLIQSLYNKLSDEQWANAEAEDKEAFACLSGDSSYGKCTKGTPGTVKLVKPGPDDFKVRERVLKDFVLKAWAKRCSDKCVADWNATAAKVIGVKAER